MDPKKFQSLIRRILREEVDKVSAVGVISPQRVPEMNGDGVNPDLEHKTFGTDDNSRDVDTKEALQADMIKTTEAIDKSVSVVWDDHDDLMITGRDMKFIRISPRWEDYYVIEMMTRNEDRVWVTGLTWDQVKEFVKVNLKRTTTYVEKAYDKSYRNRKDEIPAPDKGLPQGDKPKTLPLTDEPVDTKKNKDKNYTEDQTKKEDDLPEKPMKEVEEIKKQRDFKTNNPNSLTKKMKNSNLVSSHKAQKEL